MTVFTDLLGMRGQECDRPVALATELMKVGVVTATAIDYDWLIPFPVEWSAQTIVQWLRENAPARELLLHCDGHVLRVKLPT